MQQQQQSGFRKTEGIGALMCVVGVLLIGAESAKAIDPTGGFAGGLFAVGLIVFVVGRFRR